MNGEDTSGCNVEKRDVEMGGEFLNATGERGGINIQNNRFSVADGVMANEARSQSSPNLPSLMISACAHSVNYNNGPRMSPATSTAGVMLAKAAAISGKDKDKMAQNEKQMILIENSVAKNRTTWSLTILALFFAITTIVTLVCSYVYDEPDSVVPRQYETTASFRYEGVDVYQEGLFKLIHGRQESRGKLPEPGCIAFYDRSRSIGQRDNKEICLIDNERVQTLRFRPRDLNIGKDIAVSTGPDSFVTLYREGKATQSIFNVMEKDMWSYNFDEVSITYIRDHIYSDSSQIMVEVEGALAVPAPCVLFSGKTASPKDMRSLLMCSRTGVDSIVMNKSSFAQIGVDMGKLSRDFPFVSTGDLTSIDLYTENTFRGPELSLKADEKLDISTKEFVSLATSANRNGILTKWSDGLSAMKVSVISNIEKL